MKTVTDVDELCVRYYRLGGGLVPDDQSARTKNIELDELEARLAARGLNKQQALELGRKAAQRHRRRSLWAILVVVFVIGFFSLVLVSG